VHQIIEVSHSPLVGQILQVQVKGHPLAESSKVITKDSSGPKEEEITSDALKGESQIRSYWKIMSPDGTMTDIENFDFLNHKK